MPACRPLTFGAACLLAAITLPAPAAAPTPAAAQRVVDAYAARLQASLDADQTREVVQVEHVRTGDLDGDGRDEIVAMYVILGATYSRTGLAVFTDRGKGHELAAESGDGLGQVETVDVRDGLVFIKTMVLGPGDPRCCPSKSHTYRYRWHGGRLTEIAGEATASTGATSAWEIRPLAGGPPGVRVAGPGIVDYVSLLCTNQGPIIAFMFSGASPAPSYTALLDLDNQRVSLPLSRAPGGANIWTANLGRSPLPRLLVEGGQALRVNINTQWQGELPLHGAAEAARTALSSCYGF